MKQEFFVKNREFINSKLKNDSVMVIFSGYMVQKTGDEYYPFTVNRNFYYLTGLTRENMIYLSVKKDDKVEEFLFIEESNEFIEKWVGDRVKKAEAQDVSGIKNILYINDFMSRLKSLFNYSHKGVSAETLYLDIDRELNLKPYALSYLEEFLNNNRELKLVNAQKYFYEARMIKSDEEINMMTKAIEMTKNGIEKVMKEITPGKNEKAMEALFEYQVKLSNATDLAFQTIMASGAHACVLHYSKNSDILKENELLLMDLGASNGVYNADISRTIPVDGKFTERQKEIYSIVLDVNKACIAYAKPGLLLSELQEYAKKMLAKKCLEIGLIKKEEEVEKYYFHSVSHFLGMNTHDVGIYTLRLKEGMVITIEPGLYISEEKLGIRIEDDILITKDGAINLSKDIIKEIDDIESFMKK